ncbi:hypothetical protein HOLleu_40286 [Holothuria leucospilota]|uniref:Peptidase A2 domain-containing protein n=1 Tax=Holothuria leucospilota TaxID=206669 RepID=A0A9Q0YFW0_HOLLE|nr:hypothetical protein HOLleu_40286 [Holothuria leucospilota]
MSSPLKDGSSKPGKRTGVGSVGPSPTHDRQRWPKKGVGPTQIHTARPCNPIDASGAFVTVKIHERPVQLLVDSGATVTVISERTFQDLPPSVQAELKSKDKFVLMADGSSKIRDKGTIVLDVEAANKRFRHEIHVMDIEYEGILGLDFMINHDCQLDWKRGKICFDGVDVELHSQAIQDAVFRFSVKETTIVPPGSEAIVAAQLVKIGRCHHAVKKDGLRNGYVSPLQSFHDRHDVVVAHALVDASQEVVIERPI